MKNKPRKSAVLPARLSHCYEALTKSRRLAQCLKACLPQGSHGVVLSTLAQCCKEPGDDKLSFRIRLQAYVLLVQGVAAKDWRH